MTYTITVTNNGLTVKRCMPFFDAMATGWLLPLAATVRLEVKDDGRVVNAGWEFDRVMVSNHGAHQVAGNPKEPSPPCKFHNYWSVRTPPGWSCLFLPPLNRPPQPFECVAGIIGKEHRRTRPQAREQIDLIVLQRQGFQASGELDAPILPSQHGEHRLDVITRAGQ